MTALAGLRVIELTDERTSFAGRLLAELGADVVVVEPPGGAALRRRGPFVDDVPGPERSLRWWAESVGKRSVVVDLDAEAGRARFADLVSGADVVLEGRGNALDAVGAGWSHHRDANPHVVWVSVTPFGRDAARAGDPATDLTLMAGGGPMWNCGYDDHSIPPMRGAGDQSYKIAGYQAAIGALIAVLARPHIGRGQLVDVSVTATCNTTAEQVTYNWLLAKEVCIRQTGRHAFPFMTLRVQVTCADGAIASTGVLPRMPSDFAALHSWLTDLGAIDELPEAPFLELGAAHHGPIDLALLGTDDEVTAICDGARRAIRLIASRLSAKEFFEQAQRRGFPVGAVLSPDEAYEQEHFVERGLHVEVEHPEFDRTVRYVGPAARYSASPPARPRRPPHIGEHDDEVFAEYQRMCEAG